MAAGITKNLTALCPEALFRITALAYRRDLADDEHSAPLPGEVAEHAVDSDWHRLNHELIDEIRGLDEPAQCELIALMWLGRADGNATWSELLDDARRMSDIGNPHYVAGKLRLYEHLEKGWTLLHGRSAAV